MISIQTIHVRAERLLRQAQASEFTTLKCESCQEQVDVKTATPDRVEFLVAHCTYDHLSHEGIIGITEVSMVGGYALSASIGAPPRTDHEERWRMSVARHPSRR